MTLRTKLVVAMFLFVGTALTACVSRPAPRVIYPPDAPALPPLELANAKPVTPSIFGPADSFTPSRLSNVGRSGLFDVHPARSSQVAILSTPEDAFAARVQSLRNADTSVRIQSYIFTGDEAGHYIGNLLKKKKEQGLDVKVIVDAVANTGFRTQSMYFDLKQHGIEMEGYEGLFLEWLSELPVPFGSGSFDPLRINKRFHEKMWVTDAGTDHAVAIVGGLNVANEYFRLDPLNPDLNWRDQDVMAKGDVVQDIARAFDRNYDYFLRIKRLRGPLNISMYWSVARRILSVVGNLPVPHWHNRTLRRTVKGLARHPVNLAYAPVRTRFFQNRPRYGESYIEQAYLKSIDDARGEVLISSAYFIPSDAFRESVKRAARRCVRVVILTNSPETTDFPELPMVGRDSYRDMLGVNAEPGVKACGEIRGRAGIEIWEWQGRWLGGAKQTEGTMHSKYAVFDRRWSIVGSHNLDPRSERLNSESMIAFQSDVLSEQLATIFYEVDLGFSRQISLLASQAFGTTGDLMYRLRKMFGDIFEQQL